MQNNQKFPKQYEQAREQIETGRDRLTEEKLKALDTQLFLLEKKLGMKNGVLTQEISNIDYSNSSHENISEAITEERATEHTKKTQHELLIQQIDAKIKYLRILCSEGKPIDKEFDRFVEELSILIRTGKLSMHEITEILSKTIEVQKIVYQPVDNSLPLDINESPQTKTSAEIIQLIDENSQAEKLGELERERNEQIHRLNTLLAYERDYRLTQDPEKQEQISQEKLEEYTHTLLEYLYPDQAEKLSQKIRIVTREQFAEDFLREYRKQLGQRLSPEEVELVISSEDTQTRINRAVGVFWRDSETVYVNQDKALHKKETQEPAEIETNPNFLNLELMGFRNTVVHETQHVLSSHNLEMSDSVKQDFAKLLPNGTRFIDMWCEAGVAIKVLVEHEGQRKLLRYSGLNELLTQTFAEKAVRDNGLTMMEGFKLSKDARTMMELANRLGITYDELHDAYFEKGPEPILTLFTEYFDGNTQKAYSFYMDMDNLYHRKATFDEIMSRYNLKQ